MNILNPIYDTENENLYLYHYTKFKNAKKILKTMQLRFNKYGYSNDPYETKTLYFSILTQTNSNDPKKTIESLSKCENALKDWLNKYKIVCFTKDSDRLEKDSLSGRGCSKLRMWSQYGENHKGVCLVFNRNKFHQVVEASYKEKCISDDISYKDLFQNGAHEHRMNISSLVLNQNHSNINEAIGMNLATFPKEMFFLKDADWEHENEYRYILINEEKNAAIGISDCLEGLIMGDAIEKKNANFLINLCNERNIFIRKLVFADYFYLSEVFQDSNQCNPFVSPHYQKIFN